MRKVPVIFFLLLISSWVHAAGPVDVIKSSGVIPGVSENYNPATKSENAPVLYGVFVSSTTKKAILYDKKQNKRVVVKEGDQIDDFVVKSIKKDEVVLASGGKVLILKPFSESAAEYRSRFVRAKVAYASYSEPNLPSESPQKNRSRTNSRRAGHPPHSSTNQKNSPRKTTTKKPIPLPFARLAEKLKKSGQVNNPFFKLIERLNRGR